MLKKVAMFRDGFIHILRTFQFPQPMLQPKCLCFHDGCFNKDSAECWSDLSESENLEKYMVIGNALIQAIFLSIVNVRLPKLQKLQLKTPPSALWDVSHRPGVCWGQNTNESSEKDWLFNLPVNMEIQRYSYWYTNRPTTKNSPRPGCWLDVNVSKDPFSDSHNPPKITS